MKRFITYLYEYEGGHKGKNTGFIRVDERKGLVNMQISVRNLIRSHEKGKAYALVKDSVLKEIELGELGVINGQGDTLIRFSSSDLMNSSYSLADVVGIGIRFSEKVYLASCWKDEAADEIGCGIEEVPIVREEILLDGKEQKELDFGQEIEIKAAETTDVITYQKLELNQIRTLPSKNWYLCNNRFLVHGFWNYGYLVLKKKISATKEMAYLGVPGVFEKPEMVMATLFGFPEFETLPMEVSEAQMDQEVMLEDASFSNKKSQEPKTGTFGCWLVPLQV